MAPRQFLAALTLACAAAPSAAYNVSAWHAGTRCEEGDVNALFEFRGVWHVFHQFRNRPATSIGHAASRDLLHWARLPDALESGPTVDSQCYDGGASLLPRNGVPQPMLMIDGGCGMPVANGPFCMESTGASSGGVTAFPEDPDDPMLTNWSRVGPTAWLPCNGTAWPSPVWRNEARGVWNLLAVNFAVNGMSRFESTNDSFTAWHLADESFIEGIKGLGGGMWHVLPPNVDGVPGGRWATHIMQGALGNGFNGLPNFVMGVYDAAAETYTNVSAPMLLDAGGGVNYAQLSWTATGADPRVLFVSWLRLTEPAPPDCGTQGQLTALRDLRFDPRLNRLVFNPIAEYATLRSAAPIFNASLALPAGGPPLQLFDGVGGGGVIMDVEAAMTLPASGAAAAVMLSLRCAANRDDGGCAGGAIITVFAAAADAAGGRACTLTVDYTYHVSTPFVLLPGEASLPLRVLSDLRSLEIFAGAGRGVVSVSLLSADGAVYAAAPGGGPSVVLQATGWAMTPTNY